MVIHPLLCELSKILSRMFRRKPGNRVSECLTKKNNWQIKNAVGFSPDKMLPLSDGPALISVNIYLRNIHKIDDVKMVRNQDG